MQGCRDAGENREIEYNGSLMLLILYALLTLLAAVASVPLRRSPWLEDLPWSGLRRRAATWRRLACALFFLAAATTAAWAQSLPPQTADDQMGSQPFQSYHGGNIDQVGLANGTKSKRSLLQKHLVLKEGYGVAELHFRQDQQAVKDLLGIPNKKRPGPGATEILDLKRDGWI